MIPVLAVFILAHAAGAEPRIAYELSLTTAPRRAEWLVTLSASGLDTGRRNVGAVLHDWGEWTRADSLYLRDLESRPPLARDPEVPGDFRFELPPKWDGRLLVSYRLAATEAGSRAQQTFGLLPFSSGTSSVGYSENTLLGLRVGAEELVQGRTLTLAAPKGWTIATGWGGSSLERQTIQLATDARNTTIGFGVPTSVAVSSDADGPIEVIQFDAGPKTAEAVLAIAAPLRRAYSETTGVSAGPLRILLSDKDGGGTATDGALSLQALPMLASDPKNPWQVHFVAHELFHCWLPGRFAKSDPEATAWFHEGFTEYLSLWHAAKVGLVSRDWFAQRLGDHAHELKDDPALGKVAFGDAKVQWRDGDGPNETLAYKGGALFAFALDVELRKLGRPGLMELIRDLLEEGTYTRESLRGWMIAHGLRSFVARHFDAPAPPGVDAALKFAERDARFFSAGAAP